MNALTFPKRTPKRSRVFLSAHVDAGTGPVPVRIRDISTSGALLESDVAPNVGDTLELSCGTTTGTARVVWVDRRWFGVEFLTPLTVGALVDATGTTLRVSAPRTYHAGEPLE